MSGLPTSLRAQRSNPENFRVETVDRIFRAPCQCNQALQSELDEAERKAWQALARYKFQMFGYWAAIWVHLNRIGGFKRPNPWGELVQIARAKRQP